MFDDQVECTCRGDPGAVFLSSTVRSAVFATQGKNMITKASVLESLNTFENERRHLHRYHYHHYHNHYHYYHLHRVFFTDREGTQPDQVHYYPSMDYGPDANRTLELKELVVFTDFLDILRAPLTR